MILRTCFAVAACAVAPWSQAAAATPPLATLSARDTVDLWSQASGGVSRGQLVLDKLQLASTVNGAAVGLDGLRAHVQVYATAGRSLSAKVGDVQTVSNIEAPEAVRLFEAWVEQAWGPKDAGGLSVRAGLIDLNSEFDSVDPASLFINSSHGIAPDLSKSGVDGPSIFPVSSAGLRLAWTPTSRWALRGAVFDGVAGDPDRPKAFVAVRLAADDGALAIAQADYKPAKDVQFSLGAWRYSTTFDRIDGRGQQRGEAGAYGFVEGPLPGARRWSGWLRAGVGDPDLQTVAAYVGGGVVGKGLIAGRGDDLLGLAIGRAVIGGPARRRDGLPVAETTVEATYQAKIDDRFALQPDLQYVIDPAGRADLKNAVVIGLRFVFTAGAASDDTADPTVTPGAAN